MSVWLTIPSARPAREAEKALNLWYERGYKIALWRDPYSGPLPTPIDMVEVDDYPGYAKAVNRLIKRVMREDSAAEWFVVAGDDIEPDPNHSAEEIARQCFMHFRCHALSHALHGGPDYTGGELDALATFGVMQPTGDRWGDESWSRARWPKAPAYIDRVCGSAWFGREYCRRMYQGQGPLFEGYTHMFEDEEAQNVAVKMGVFWQRPDLTQKHNHWRRDPSTPDSACPAFLRDVSIGEAGRKHWADSAYMFETRRDAGFPGHEPIL